MYDIFNLFVIILTKLYNTQITIIWKLYIQISKIQLRINKLYIQVIYIIY